MFVWIYTKKPAPKYGVNQKHIDMNPITTICPRCQSKNIKCLVGEQEATSHYGREYCGDCGRHLRWIESPENTVLREENSRKVINLLAKGRVNDWEQAFLRNIQQNRKLSRKQQERLDYIWAKNNPIQSAV